MAQNKWIIPDAPLRVEYPDTNVITDPIDTQIIVPDKSYFDPSGDYANIKIEFHFSWGANVNLKNDFAQDFILSSTDNVIDGRIEFTSTKFNDVGLDWWVHLYVYGVNGAQKTELDHQYFYFKIHKLKAYEAIFMLPDGNLFEWIENEQPDYKEVKVYSLLPFYINVPTIFQTKNALPGKDFRRSTPENETFLIGTAQHNFEEPFVFNIRPDITQFENVSFNEGKYEITENLVTYFRESDSRFYQDLNLRVIADGANFSNAELYSYFAIRDIQEAEPLPFRLRSSKTMDVVFPDFIDADDITGQKTIEIPKLKPVKSNELAVGSYNDYIEVTVHDGDDFTIPVNYKIVDQVEKGYTSELVNFTKENKETIFYDNRERMMLEYNVQILPLLFFGEFTKNLSFDYKNGFFDNRSTILMGLIADRLYPRLTTNEINALFLDLLSSSEDDKIIKYESPLQTRFEYQSVSMDTTGTGIRVVDDAVRWIRGREPLMYNKGSRLLAVSHRNIRITPRSIILVNFLRNDNEKFKIKVYKNSIEHKSYDIDRNNQTFGLYLKCNDFTPGDVIEVKQESQVLEGNQWVAGEEEAIAQKHYVFPEGKQSVLLCYLSEYGKPELFECTGGFGFSTDYDHNTETTVNRSVEEIRNLDTNRKQSVIINTGYILKGNDAVVDEIVRSEKVWMYDRSSHRFIELRPKTEKLSNTDSDTDTYAFDIEFDIIPENDFQVYN